MLNDLPDVILSDKVRMPKVIQDHGIDINGWHEGNALFTGIYTEITKIHTLGPEKYIAQFAYNGNSFSLPLECENTTNPRRADGIERLWNNFLKEKFGEIKTVLDVGCGRGQAGIWFSTAGKKYIGIDISLASIGFCLALLPVLKYKYNPPTMPIYKQMLAEEITFPSKYFDLVFSCHSLEHMHNLDKAIFEQVRLGKNITGVIAKPEKDECGEHLHKIGASDIKKYLDTYCSSYGMDENGVETIFWGVVK